jgi:hypothetical protein
MNFQVPPHQTNGHRSVEWPPEQPDQPSGSVPVDDSQSPGHVLESINQYHGQRREPVHVQEPEYRLIGERRRGHDDRWREVFSTREK